MKSVKEILTENNCTFVAVNNSETRISVLRGVAPIIKLIDEEPEFLNGACVADKVIGKAAAILLYKYGVKEIYTPLTSDHAIKYLSNKNIKFEYNEKTEHIINRTKTDMCPMEKAVLYTNDETEAEQLIRNKIKELAEKQ